MSPFLLLLAPAALAAPETAGPAAAPAPPTPAAEPAAPPAPDPDFEAGVAAMKAKRPADAAAAFLRCVATNPACAWELGWARWVQRDWKGVLAAWSGLPPEYPGLRDNLVVARGHLAARELAAELRRTAPATFVSSAPPGASVRLRAVGDMMIGTAFPAGFLPADHGAATFLDVGPALADADFTFGNLEGPLCDEDVESLKCKPDAKAGSCYAFRTPTAYAPLYKAAGFDVVSTANNHAADFGEVCRDQTEAALAAQGILHSGRPGTVATWTQNGLRIALIGFHTNPSCHDLNDVDGAVALVSGLAAQNDLVIVSFHGGAEGSKAQHVPEGHELFYGEDRGDLRAFSHAVVDAGADLVLGHGPHVLRAMEMYRDRLIVYSMGNFATYGRFNLTGAQALGVIVEVTLAADGRFTGGRLISTVQVGEGVPTLDPENEGADVISLLSQQDFPETGVTVAQDGTLGAPNAPR
jgi:poly-gamma-glutamate capsule biosynthesis protein CapA/YwtB (metallophosphatase superfamily)